MRLRSCTREAATVARLGGDEFAIIEDVTDPGVEAASLAERIQKVLSAPFALGDHQVIIGTSIGIAIAPGDGTDCDDILRNADLALYRAKGEGRGTHRFFEPEMDQLMQERCDLERHMRKALVNGEFELYFQPFVNLASGEISGCEALLRWHHPTRGLISPADFIPLAEETGVIVPLGEWVLRTACREAANWSAELRIAVNLSPAQLRSKELVPVVIRTLAEFGNCPAPARTRSDRVGHDAGQRSRIQDARSVAEIGRADCAGRFRHRLLVFELLAEIPVRQGQDRSQLRATSCWVQETSSRRIARAVVRFAASLGKTITAEGVETEEQLEILRAERCTEMQGYYFSRPKRASEIAGLLAGQAAKTASAA